MDLVGMKDKMSRPKIVLFGDSITQLSFSAIEQGFGAHLSDVYQRRADVLNRGYSGYNTDWALRLLSSRKTKSDIFGDDAKNIKLMTVFFGANDASDAVLNARQHVPVDRYKSNLKEIVATIQSECCKGVKVIIIAPPPVHHEGRLRYQKERFGEKATGKLERTLSLSRMYATAAEDVSKELDLPCLNVWEQMCAEGGDVWPSFLSDGLHLSKPGNAFVGSKLFDLISTTLPELSVRPCLFTGHYGTSGSKSSIIQIAPWHDEIDHLHPDEAFGRK